MMEKSHITVGKSLTTLHMPRCLHSDSANTPLNTLFMEENSHSPTSSQTRERTPERPRTISKRVTGTIKRKLELEFESLSGRNTPEGDMQSFKRLMTFWEKKSGGGLGDVFNESKPSVVNRGTEIPDQTPSVNNVPSPFTPKMSPSAVIKEYAETVLKSSNTGTPVEIANIDDGCIPVDGDIWELTPITSVSSDSSMVPPSSFPEVVASSRQSRSRQRNLGPAVRSKSTGHLDLFKTSAEYSADDLTPVRRQRDSKSRPRRLMSLNPTIYSQLYSSLEAEQSLSYDLKPVSNQDARPLADQPSKELDPLTNLYVQKSGAQDHDLQELTPMTPIPCSGNCKAPPTSPPEQHPFPNMNRSSDSPPTESTSEVDQSPYIDQNQDSEQTNTIPEQTDSTSNEGLQCNQTLETSWPSDYDSECETLPTKRKTSLDHVSLADISAIRPSDNASMREISDSTFDVTFDLRNECTFDKSSSRFSMTFEQSSLDPGVKDMIHNVVDGFVNNPDTSAKQAPNQAEEADQLSSIQEEFLYFVSQVDSLAQRAAEDVPQPDPTIQQQVLDANNNLEPMLDGHNTNPVLYHPVQPMIIDTESALYSCDNDLITVPHQSTQVDTIPGELGPRHSEELYCPDSPTLHTPDPWNGTMNDNMDWSTELLDNTSSSISTLWLDESDITDHDQPVTEIPVVPQSDSMTNVGSLDMTEPYSPTDHPNTTHSSCNSTNPLYIDTSISSVSNDSDCCYKNKQETIKASTNVPLTAASGFPPTDYQSPIIKSPYTRFSSPSYSSDEPSTPLVLPQITPHGEWQSPAPNTSSFTWSSDSEDDIPMPDQPAQASFYQEDPLDLRTCIRDDASNSGTTPVCRENQQPTNDPVVPGSDYAYHGYQTDPHTPDYVHYLYKNQHTAVVQRDFSQWTEYTVGHVNFAQTPIYTATQYSQTVYNNRYDQPTYLDRTSPVSRNQAPFVSHHQPTPCLYQQLDSDTYVVPGSFFNSTVTIPTSQSNHVKVDIPAATPNSHVPVPILNSTPDLSVNPFDPSYDPSPTNNQNPSKIPEQDGKKRSSLFGMMAHSIKKKFTEKFCKAYTNRPDSIDTPELLDTLKNVPPYVITGWLTSNFLMSLVNKRDALNTMFEDPVDDNGNIHQWIIDSCRKNTPAIFTKDLVFRVFTLQELQDLNFRKLNRRKLSAVRRCVKAQFQTMTPWCWRSKCIPLVKSSVTTLFKHRVKHVQMFFIMHSK